MKPNAYKFWNISLHGPKAGDLHAVRFHGQIDAALSHADELECGVDFDITKIVVALESQSEPNNQLSNSGHQPTP